ncbi:metal dependent phosphohydrolase [Marinobacterium mangrovicola]|uniref:Metal dependent phosphohydrolase n=2 Tax=Marinobacterium mangrovicola TaxID=1476959 RepID=A0A4R1GDF0_9GAMM|nr:metal dependent phosphohydrolase [Marinobacterium mangrovicola]
MGNNKMRSEVNRDLLKALELAARKHRSQTRKYDGSPYINHLIEVAYLLSEVAGVSDQGLLQAAVLHDILEDTDTSKEELKTEFSDRTLSLILAVTDDKTLTLEERRAEQISHLKTASRDVKLLKLADHCSNIAAIPGSWPEAKVEGYLAWSQSLAQLCFDASEELAQEYRSRLDLSLNLLEI